jgi:hypothetical protein
MSAIARRLGRPPTTITREVAAKGATGRGEVFAQGDRGLFIGPPLQTVR